MLLTHKFTSCKHGLMKIRPQYEYFYAAFKKEVDQNWQRRKKALAYDVGVSRGYISDVYHNKKTASHKLQVKIAEAFGYTIEELLERGRRILDGNPEEARAGPQDDGRLAEIIRRVEAGLEHRGIEMSANKKAAIIMWLYKHNGGASREKIEDLLGIVA